MFKDKEAGMPTEHKLLLDGSTQNYLTWAARIEQASVYTKGLDKHMAAIRTGSLPKYFVKNLKMLTRDTVLSLPAASPSVWSKPLYGDAPPATIIRVSDYKAALLALRQSDDHACVGSIDSIQESLTISDSIHASGGSADNLQEEISFNIGDSVIFTTDQAAWVNGIFTGVTISGANILACLVDEGGNDINVPLNLNHIRPRPDDSIPEEREAGKRRYKDSITPEKDKDMRPRSKPKQGQLELQDRAKASEYVAGADKFIVFLRTCTHLSAHPRLNQSRAFQDAEENADVLLAYSVLTDLALFTLQTRANFVTSTKREIEFSKTYKMDMKDGNFPEFSAKYIAIFRLLCYADPHTTQEYIVHAMVTNLPRIAPYDKIKHDVKSKIFVNQETEDAKSNLDKLVCLITDELHVHAANASDPLEYPSSNSKETDLRALIFALEARAESGARRHSDKHRPKTDSKGTRSVDTRPPEDTITSPCRNFAANKCKNGNDCRFGHPDASGKDPRVLNGNILPAYKKSIDEKNAARIRQAGEPNKPRTERILTLNAEIEDLKKKISAYEF